jgi:two-component system CheB/CheR fusion protein
VPGNQVGLRGSCKRAAPNTGPAGSTTVKTDFMACDRIRKATGVVAAGVVVLDADLLVRSWNKGAEELWGLRADEVRNQPFFGLDFGLPAADVRDIVHECLTSGKRAGPIQVGAINRIGRTITCTVTCSPLKASGDGDKDRDGAVLLMEETYPG